MTALPITLEEALRHQGYTIDAVEFAEKTITLDSGTIVVPDMVLSQLTWRHDYPAELGSDFYLSKLPIFSEDYRPVILSHILDRFRTRRLAYNTPGEWMLGFRRWSNLTMPFLNRRYVSTATDLPLDDRDETDVVEATSHGLDVGSDFPQSLISGNTDFATAATDKRQADNGTTRRTGRSTSVMDLLERQRSAYLNVDAEVLAGLEYLFLQVLDQGEGNPAAQYGLPFSGLPRLHWDLY